ncbi:DEAD/DEAH box helicase [Photobacterium sp. J15]|uniref:DEAD/DEAH box helicase n=1 Tax=Photobacterium sp. J15 TaxID=265901 RepID=UPI0007E3BE5A|nr:AAA domain-containing protein [Photobacterium sp. J15]
MKLGKFSGLAPQTIQLISHDNVAIESKFWSVGDEVSVIEDSGYYYVIQGEQNLKVKPIHAKEELRLKVTRGQVLWALTSIKKGRFYLRNVEVADAPTVIDLDLGISSKIVQQLYERGEIQTDTVEAASQWLTDEFILGGDVQQRVFVSVYAGSQNGTLEIRGCDWVATLDELDGYWSISKLSRTRRSGVALRVLMGDIRFVDVSVAGQLNNPIHRHALEDAVRSHGGYMQLWQQYSDMEWAISLEAARELGGLTFKDRDKGDHLREWVFSVTNENGRSFHEKWKQLKDKEKQEPTLEVMGTLPDWLDNEQDVEGTGLTRVAGKPWLCNLVRVDDGLVTLRITDERDRKPPKEGVICLSMHGHRKVRERRLQAVNCIQQRNNQMPQLHYLLEGIDIPYEKPKTLRPLSRAARERFKGEPTSKQKEALKVALNTPDVAIIIGPPGTGKTQVITALQVRLAEEQKDLPIQHQMLVSSFQHDAVDNVMERSNVFGLPGIKTGGKKQKNDDQNENPIVSWCLEKASKLDKTLSSLCAKEPVFAEVRSLQKYLIVLRLSKPGYQQKQELVESINRSLDTLAEAYQIRLSPSIQRQWNEWSTNILDTCSSVGISENRFLIRRARALRTTLSSFKDDGMNQCIRFLDACGSENYQLTDKDRRLLELLGSKSQPDDNELSQLKTLKVHLLDQLIPDYRPRHVQRVMSENECLLLDSIHDEVEQLIKESDSLAYLKVLEEYHSALTNTPETIKKAVSEYTAVLGATCQQAASDPMIDLKQVRFQDALSFNTVIVDEAARANPLDLMVPMAMGKRRIVLVGDHRQLPHLLEPKVEDELAEKFELSQVHKEMLNTSLFQRMMQGLLALEKEKGQPKRVVMLDTQFRMHPVLGKYISEQFYERYGLPEIYSGLNEEDFEHQVPGYEGKVCGWIDVPRTDGASYRFNGSLRRDEEARVIATKAKEILVSCPNLSVGVITFYSAQVSCILEAMIAEELTDRSENREPVIKPEWQFLVNDKGEQEERLRVGSVDAFQGKEFDVVLLSVVRTFSGSIDINDDDALTRAYGFLRLDNRLNVAMSRQKRLLIAVGDKELCNHPAAEVAVPALPAYFQLCGEYGKIQ